MARKILQPCSKVAFGRFGHCPGLEKLKEANADKNHAQSHCEKRPGVNVTYNFFT
jgi:hypothetical protein